MSKLLIGFILIICFCGLAWADTATITDTRSFLDPGGYKDAKWGMTKEEVFHALPNVIWKNLTQDYTLSYEDTILKHKTTCLLSFYHNKGLFYVAVLIKAKVIKKQPLEYDSIDLFNSVLKLLKEKYGKPTEAKEKTHCCWIFPTTKIELFSGKAHPEDTEEMIVGISYSKCSIKEGDEDKL